MSVPVTPPAEASCQVVVADGDLAGTVVTSGLVPWVGTWAEADALVMLMAAQAAKFGHVVSYEVVELYGR